MKAVRIEFVGSNQWKVVWVVVLAITLVMVALFFRSYSPVQQSLKTQQLQLHAMQLQLQQARTPVVYAADPRRASLEHAHELLQQDLNKVFNTIENASVVGTRVRSMVFDGGAYTLTLEYEMDTLYKAASITETLNAGYEQHPWRFDSVNSANVNPSSSVAPVMTLVTPNASQFRGVWSAQVKLL